MQEVNNTLPYDAQALPDIASALRSGEEEPKKVQEPLPEVPKGPLTVSEAYAFLGVPEADRGQLEKVKARFRKLSLKYHPDKNTGAPTPDRHRSQQLFLEIQRAHDVRRRHASSPRPAAHRSRRPPPPTAHCSPPPTARPSQVLSDASKRRLYDAERSRAARPVRGFGGGRGFGGFGEDDLFSGFYRNYARGHR